MSLYLGRNSRRNHRILYKLRELYLYLACIVPHLASERLQVFRRGYKKPSWTEKISNKETRCNSTISETVYTALLLALLRRVHE